MSGAHNSESAHNSKMIYFQASYATKLLLFAHSFNFVLLAAIEVLVY